MLRTLLALLILACFAGVASAATVPAITVFTNYTVKETDDVIYADTTAGNITITLPPYPSIGARYSVIMPAGAGIVSFAGKAQTITAVGTGIQWTYLASGYQALGLGGGGGGGGGGTVTSVAVTVPPYLTVTGSPITSTGTLAIGLSGTPLPVANGGTGVTGMTNGQVLIGTGSGASPGTITAGSGIAITNGSGTVTIAATGGSTSFISTGSTASRTPADRAAEVWNVQDFGCVADGTTAGAGTDNSSALAAAVTAANAAYVASGQPVSLSLGNGTYALASTVAWKSGVVLQGPGCLVVKNANTATGAMWSLIKGASLTDIGFRDVTSYGVGPDRKIAGTCTDSASLGNRDSFVDLDSCNNISIQRCQMFRHQNAVLVSQVTTLRIDDCLINSLSSKTLAQLDAGTFTLYSFTGDPGGGIRVLGERSGVNQTESRDIIVANNIIICVGLDQGIDMASQSGYPVRCVVSGNYVAGSSAGIQCYTSGGAVPDPGTLTTTDRSCHIIGNHLQWVYEEGIYIRGVEGISVIGNHIDRCAIIGTLSGSSAGGILERIPTIHTFNVSAVSHDLYNLIEGNLVTDCGNPTNGVLDAGIRCDNPYGLVTGNVVVRSLDRFGANLRTANSYGICTVDVGGVAGVSDAVHNLLISNNQVRGFGTGLQMSYVTSKTTLNGGFSCSIQDCHFDTVATGITLTTKSSGYHVDHCTVTNATVAGITLKNTPYSSITRCTVEGAPIGIQVSDGNQASDFYSIGGRMGPTVKLNGNTINGATTPISVNNTTTGDISVISRCLECKDNTVDGTLFNRDSVGSFTFTAAPTASNFRIWHIGDIAPERTPTDMSKGWVCTTAGAFGAAIATTASTTNGSTAVTFSATTVVVPDDYVAIAGVTGTKHVLTIDPSTNSCVIDVAADATVTGAAITRPSPVFSNVTGVTHGGTGLATATAHGVLIGEGTSAMAVTAVGTTGQVLTGVTGGDPIWAAAGGSGTVTSVSATVPSFLSIAGSPVTTSGTLAFSLSGTALPVANGGTGQTAYTDGQLMIGNTATGLTNKATITAGTNVSVVNGNGTITIAATAGSNGNYTTVADAAYTMLGTDAIVAYTSLTATRVVTLPAATTVAPGRLCMVKDLSSSVTQAINITISRAGSDTIEGGTVSWNIRTPKGWRVFESDGVSNWHLVGMSRDLQFWIGAGTNAWNVEPGAKYGRVEIIAGGAGGAGGAREPSGTASVGGGGGSGGGYSAREFLISDAGTSQTVVIGAGGTGGAGATTNGTAGSNSTAGGNTTFASGVTGISAYATGGGLATGGGAGAGGGVGSAGQGLSSGGAAGIASTTGAAASAGAATLGAGGGGGGGGGGISTAGTPFTNGGHGGSPGCFDINFGTIGISGNARGSSDGAAGGSPGNRTPAGYVVGAPGAGGGASSILTTGGAGGAGARPGGGGGGGGASLNGQNGGTGGAGGDGAAFVWQGL